MGKALYRKYRSKSFDDVIGQEHIIETLKKAIKSGRVSHAYLFSGPRGVGKTSVARVLAHEVNNLEYTDESIHLDIIEIDAASNRRIDEIRDLREKVHIAPTSAKYKVYIIDEVHMLTKEAFNALLKTLEEPPAHCIFVLATTEAHKLPETIISRTQHFNFKQIPAETAAAHLATIAKNEKIDVEPGALRLLAEHGGGSFRDSISMLDQLSGSGAKITEQMVLEALGLPARKSLDHLMNSITSGQSGKVLKNLQQLQEQGSNPVMIAKELSQLLRQRIIEGDSGPWISRLLQRLLDVAGSSQPQDSLEIFLLEASASNSAPSRPKLVIPQPVDTPRAKPEPAVETTEAQAPLPKAPEEENVAEPESLTPKTKSGKFELDSWPLVVETVKDKAASLYTALRLAHPTLNDQTLVLSFQFPLHQKKLNKADNKHLVERLIEELTGATVKIECVVDKSLEKFNEPVAEVSLAMENSKQASQETIQIISNIFGTGEVLES